MAIFEMPHKNENDSFHLTNTAASILSVRMETAKITYLKVLHFAFHSIFKSTEFIVCG